MKFQDLKNNLKERVLNNYLLHGVDEFLLSSAYNLILKFANIECADLNLITFNEGIIDCNDVVRALDTMPVFSDRKMVYLDIRMSRKTELKNINALQEYLTNPNPQSILVVNVGDNIDAFALDKKLFNEVDCNRLDFKIISLKIKSTFAKFNKLITDDAVITLSDYCIGDLAKILIECEKISNYVGQRQQVEKADIMEIVTPNIEYQIYELTENLAKKDSVKVYTILNDMKAKKDEYRTLPALIFAHFRRLFMISLNKTNTNLELSKMLGVKEYAIKMSANQVKLFSKSALKKIHELCVKVDGDLKQSNISIDNAINLIVLTILNI